MEAPFPSPFSHIQKDPRFGGDQRCKGKKEGKGKKRGDRARSNARLACHETAGSIRAKKRISTEENAFAFSVLHVSVFMHNLYIWFWDMKEN